MWLPCQRDDVSSTSSTWWAGGLFWYGSYCSIWVSTYENKVVIRSCLEWNHLFSWNPPLYSACPHPMMELWSPVRTLLFIGLLLLGLSKAYGMHRMASVQSKTLLCSSINQKGWTLPELDDSWCHFSVSWLLSSLPFSTVISAENRQSTSMQDEMSLK